MWLCGLDEKSNWPDEILGHGQILGQVLWSMQQKNSEQDLLVDAARKFSRSVQSTETFVYSYPSKDFVGSTVFFSHCVAQTYVYVSTRASWSTSVPFPMLNTFLNIRTLTHMHFLPLLLLLSLSFQCPRMHQTRTCTSERTSVLELSLSTGCCLRDLWISHFRKLHAIADNGGGETSAYHRPPSLSSFVSNLVACIANFGTVQIVRECRISKLHLDSTQRRTENSRKDRRFPRWW